MLEKIIILEDLLFLSHIIIIIYCIYRIENERNIKLNGHTFENNWNIFDNMQNTNQYE